MIVFKIGFHIKLNPSYTVHDYRCFQQHDYKADLIQVLGCTQKMGELVDTSPNSVKVLKEHHTTHYTYLSRKRVSVLHATLATDPPPLLHNSSRPMLCCRGSPAADRGQRFVGVGRTGNETDGRCEA